MNLTPRDWLKVFALVFSPVTGDGTHLTAAQWICSSPLFLILGGLLVLAGRMIVTPFRLRRDAADQAAYRLAHPLDPLTGRPWPKD
jgi:hypothetical protein